MASVVIGIKAGLPDTCIECGEYDYWGYDPEDNGDWEDLGYECKLNDKIKFHSCFDLDKRPDNCPLGMAVYDHMLYDCMTDGGRDNAE